jgi:hypothetical protein
MKGERHADETSAGTHAFGGRMEGDGEGKRMEVWLTDSEDWGGSWKNIVERLEVRQGLPSGIDLTSKGHGWLIKRSLVLLCQ